MLSEKRIRQSRDEARRLILLQVRLLEQIGQDRQLVTPASVSERGERSDSHLAFTAAAIADKVGVLCETLDKLEHLEMVLAVVGTMKAGKSTSINAIVGREVLPNRNRASTALPTLIRHRPGMQQPELRFVNRAPVVALVKALGDRLKQAGAGTAALAIDSHHPLAKLAARVKAGFEIKDHYLGQQDIFDFLTTLNDLVRLADELDIAFPFDSYRSIGEFPCIEIEFFHLKEMPAQLGCLTLLDTPGFNEAGQSRHLRKMMQEQLRKATAVLAVFDYGQLNSQADQELRDEIMAVVGAAGNSDKLYALVNKFDGRDKNGDDEATTLHFVGRDLLGGQVAESRIFPVSMRNAFWAKQAEFAIEEHGCLPKDQKWVGDFGQLAFGTRWERQIGDPAQVLEACADIWRDARFGAPLAQVIEYGYRSAAHQAVYDAADRLKTQGDQLLQMLHTRQDASRVQHQDLIKLAEQAQRQIDNFARWESEVNTKLKHQAAMLQQRVDRVMASGQAEIQQAIKTFLTRGQLQSARIFEAQLLEALRRFKFFNALSEPEQSAYADAWLKALPLQPEMATQMIDGLRKLKAGSSPDELEQYLGEQRRGPASTSSGNVLQRLAAELAATVSGKKKEGRGYAPELRYTSREAAEQALEQLTEQVGALLNAQVRKVSAELSTAQHDFEAMLHQALADVSQGANAFERESSSAGLARLKVQLPEVPELRLNALPGLADSGAIDTHSRSYTVRREQSGIWGSTKRALFGWLNDDAGYDEVRKTETSYSVAVDNLVSYCHRKVEAVMEELRATVSESFSEPCADAANQLFGRLTDGMAMIQESLRSGQRDQELGQQQQGQMMAALQALVEQAVDARQDVLGLLDEVAQARQAMAQALAQQVWAA